MRDPADPDRGAAKPEAAPESLADVLASIRALVSSETIARLEGRASADVILLTPDMRVDAPLGARAADVLVDGIVPDGEVRPMPGAAPILDEEALRGMINAIVREELQGELGDRITRNLRKLIRREIAQLMAEAGKSWPDRAEDQGQD